MAAGPPRRGKANDELPALPSLLSRLPAAAAAAAAAAAHVHPVLLAVLQDNDAFVVTDSPLQRGEHGRRLAGAASCSDIF